mmetsp:Transcript_19306/g.33851  ORF Transcript_19306/g.33851 Transcript_19306/m.33851 type:complete len:167 (-) Transcript_19306:228-728(-)
MVITMSWMLLVLAGLPMLILEGCDHSSDAGGKAACAKNDLLCLCKADCQEACHQFNITDMGIGAQCAKCMTSKCAQEAKTLCPQDSVSLCHNCITDGAVCWATTWPSCVEQCLRWWEPISCTQCWLTNYTAQCLGSYSHCFDPNDDAPTSRQSTTPATIELSSAVV